jgi:hypothetical protein
MPGAAPWTAVSIDAARTLLQTKTKAALAKLIVTSAALVVAVASAIAITLMSKGAVMFVAYSVFAAIGRQAQLSYVRHKKLRAAIRLTLDDGTAHENGEFLRIGRHELSEYISVTPIEIQAARNHALPRARIMK